MRPTRCQLRYSRLMFRRGLPIAQRGLREFARMGQRRKRKFKPSERATSLPHCGGHARERHTCSRACQMTLAGREPAIFGSEDQRLIH